MSEKQDKQKKSIGVLCNNGYRFRIPAYQRGYRWTPDQVTDLLNDIDSNPVGRMYCLQPLVVKKVTDKNGEYYELIDGQQRLTTIYLILCALSNNMKRNAFSLSFDREVKYKSLKTDETNPTHEQLQLGIEDGSDFLEALKSIVGIKRQGDDNGKPNIQQDFNQFFAHLEENEGSENIDRVYLLQAINTIIDHYYDEHGEYRRKNIDASAEGTLIERIKGNFYFLWYETAKGDSAEAAFSRLNSGKISLNNADLIKALLLRKENLGTPEELEIRRTEIISQWDNMEQILRSDDDRFWNFLVAPSELQKSGNNYFSRLEIIFDLQTASYQSNAELEGTNSQYRIYRFFEDMAKKQGGTNPVTDKIWSETVVIFNLLREWYEDHELYHYIGYLSCIPLDYMKSSRLPDKKSPEILSANGTDWEKVFSSWNQVLKRFIQYARDNSKNQFRAQIKELVRWTVEKQCLAYEKQIKKQTEGENDYEKLLCCLTYRKDENDGLDDDLIENKVLIKNLLLLCNVQELITSKNMRDTDHKFCFKAFKSPDTVGESLTLEHIFPQHPEFASANNQDLKKEDLQKKYTDLYDNLKEYGIKITNDKHKDYNPDNTEDLKDAIRDLWKDANGQNEIKYPQRFYNLTLLPHAGNASLGNAIFPVKRAKLLDMDDENINENINENEKVYVPLSTQNVFLKRYSWRKNTASQEQNDKSQHQESPLFWMEADACAYRKKMAELLQGLGELQHADTKTFEKDEKKG